MESRIEEFSFGDLGDPGRGCRATITRAPLLHQVTGYSSRCASTAKEGTEADFLYVEKTEMISVFSSTQAKSVSGQ